MMPRILFFLALLSSAFAEDFYVAQTAQGGGTGVDAANAFAVTFFNTAGNWGAGAGKISGGDTVHLVGTIASSLTIQGSGSAGNLITIVYETGAKSSKASWTVVYNGDMTTGAWYATDKSYFTIDGTGGNGIIECTDNGDGGSGASAFHQAGGMYLTGCTNFEVKGTTIRNIYLHTYNRNNETGIGVYSTWGIFLDGCRDYSVDNNFISGAYVGIHSRTSSSGARPNHHIYSNTITNCSTDIIVALGSASSMDAVDIYSNDITMGRAWFDTPDANHIDGIHCWTSNLGDITNLRIYANYIHGDPSAHCTGFIFLENLMTSPQIFNNRLIGATTAPAEAFTDISTTGGQARYFHNTTVGIANGNSGGTGLTIYSLTSISAKNNIFKTLNIGIFNPFGTVSTWDTDYNDFANLVAPGRINSTYSTTLSLWRTATGGEANSVTTIPPLDASYDLISDILHGTNTVSGTVSTDWQGDPRTNYNMGADEFSSSGGGTPAQDRPLNRASLLRTF